MKPKPKQPKLERWEAFRISWLNEQHGEHLKQAAKSWELIHIKRTKENARDPNAKPAKELKEKYMKSAAQYLDRAKQWKRFAKTIK